MTTKKIAAFLLLFFVALPSLYAGTEYGAAASDWKVFDDDPAGASISEVDAPLLGKSVVQTRGAGRTNSYLLGGVTNSDGWNNQEEFLLSWKMKTNQFTHFFVRVNTTLGWRYLHYNSLSNDNLLNANGRYIHHGLGGQFKDGKWHTWSRNLAADLKAGEPDNAIIAVNGILVSGNLAIDSIQLNATNQAPVAIIDGGDRAIEVNQRIVLDSQNSADPDGAIYSYIWRDAQGNTLSEDTTWQGEATSIGTQKYSLEISDNEDLASVATTTIDVVDSNAPTIYFDGDDGSLEGWRLSDVTPAGAAFENIVDPDDPENRAIKLFSTGTENSFILGRIDPARSWNNRHQKYFSWRSRADSNYRLYVRVTTPDGWRFIWYDTRNESKLSNKEGNYIHHGLGNGARDGQWQTFTRDLQADLELAQPGNTITAVHAVVVRGSVTLDDIALLGDIEQPEEPPAPGIPSAPTITSPEENAIYQADANIVLQWQADADVIAYDYSSVNLASGSVINSSSVEASTICAEGNCILVKANELPADDNYQLRVRATNVNGVSEWSTRNISVAELIDEPPSVPVAPTIILPADNAGFLANATIELQWEMVADAGTYEVGVFNTATDAEISSSSYNSDDVCDEGICSVRQTNAMPLGAGYQLRLRASSTQGSSDWSVRNFSIVGPSVEPPVTPPVLPPSAPEPDLPPAQPPSTPGSEPEPDLPPPPPPPPVDGPELPSPPLPRAPEIPGEPMVSQPAQFEVFEPDSNIAVKWLADTKADTYDFGFYDPLTDTTTYESAISPADICTETECTWNHQIDVPAGDGYKLRLRASNEVGNSNWIERTFSVGDSEPEPELNAAFTVSALSGPAPLNITVDASESSDPVGITEYLWDFGDEQSLSGAELVTANHVYENPGAYSIILTVKNAAGDEDSELIIVTVLEDEPPDEPTDVEAARLLAQATFGAVDESIAAVREKGIEGWIDEQLTLTSAPHLDYVLVNSNGSGRDARHEIFWRSITDGEDQLRSRVAFALSQLLVVSDLGQTLSNAQYGVTHYYDILRDNAFGNYRELLEQVTLNPVMGIFLSSLQNDKGSEETNTRADENFARELLQLFSIGLDNLNLDGTPSGGKAYTQEHVEEFARVFTGWNYKNADRWNRKLGTGTDLISPMEAFEDHHDTGSKTLLGGETVPAGLTAREDLERALDNVYAHQNIAPFVSRHLIKHLVTSNPSPAYIARVAAVFNDNGRGERGDLGATVKALLMDQEARNPDFNENFGKLREPVIRLSQLWRAFSITQGTENERGEYNTHSPALKNLSSQTGQTVLSSPSVFNFYRPDYAPNGPVLDAGLVSPESQIFTDGNIIATASRLNVQIHRHYKQTSTADHLKVSYLDFAKELELASDPQALLDRMNLLLLSGGMSADLNNLLLSHLQSLPDDEKGNIQKVQDALSLIIASPEYLVQQ